MSINNSKHVDLNVNNYSPSELFQILDIEDPTPENIKEATERLVQQFDDENNPDMANFFIEAQQRLLDAIPPPNDLDLVNFNNKFNPQNTDDKQLNRWWSEQALVQNNDIQANRNTERNQRIGLFDNIHNVMNRERLGVNQTFNLPVVQGQMNPNLKNTCTRLVNIDSQFRQNSLPAKGNLKFCDIVNPHLSVYSSTNFTVDLTDTLNNVISLKLYSITIPYSWYNVDSVYGNNCFIIIEQKIPLLGDPCTPAAPPPKFINITLPSGNYISKGGEENLYSNNIYAMINSAIQNKKKLNQFEGEPPKFFFDELTGKTIIFNPSLRYKYYFLWYLNNTENINDLTQIKELLECTSLNLSNFKEFCSSSGCEISSKANSNLGFTLGFRDMTFSIEPEHITNNSIPKRYYLQAGLSSSIFPENPIINFTEFKLQKSCISLIDLFGPRYLLLILDDYNQNHLNKGLVSIQDTETIVDLPNYFDPNLPCNIAPPNNIGQNNSYPQFSTGAPRRITQAQQTTINGIMRDRYNTTNNKLQSVTDSDTLALIPIKKSIETPPGEGLTEFSGPLQINERTYFGPVDIERLKVKLITDKGHTLNLNGSDWSFCMMADVLYQY